MKRRYDVWPKWLFHSLTSIVHSLQCPWGFCVCKLQSYLSKYGIASVTQSLVSRGSKTMLYGFPKVIKYLCDFTIDRRRGIKKEKKNMYTFRTNMCSKLHLFLFFCFFLLSFHDTWELKKEKFYSYFWPLLGKEERKNKWPSMCLWWSTRQAILLLHLMSL